MSAGLGKELGTMLLLFRIVKRIQYLNTEILQNKEAASHNYITRTDLHALCTHTTRTHKHTSSFFLIPFTESTGIQIDDLNAFPEVDSLATQQNKQNDLHLVQLNCLTW